MPRPQKKRYICGMPKSRCFSPDCLQEEETIVMTVDEYETIRLIDLENYTQEDCATQMQVSRTTVQGVYASARKKIADAIVNGKRLIIYGGDYSLCEGQHYCHGKRCKNRCRSRYDVLGKEKTSNGDEEGDSL